MRSAGVAPRSAHKKREAVQNGPTNLLLRSGLLATRGWTASISGVYGGFLDNFPLGAAFGKGLTFRMGQTHMMKYMKKLLDHIERGDIDPSEIITHRLSLEDAPNGYDTFLKKDDRCIKVVLDPWKERSSA